MKRPPRPKRDKRSDRLLNPGSSPTEIKVDFCLGPFDAMARQMDLKWGVDRLPDLISPHLAERWGITMANLNAAIEAGYSAMPDEADQTRANVIACVEACLRGFKAMDEYAEANNKPKADPTVIEFQRQDGSKFGIMPDAAYWPKIKESRPDLVLYSLQEVANALESYGCLSDFAVETKKAFPSAEVITG